MHKKLDVLQSLFNSKADLYCLVETWLTEHCTSVDVPGYSCHSVCRPVTQRGPTRGGICVYVAECLSQFVKVWRVAADNSYVWLHLPCVKVNGCETYLCVCYVAPRSSTVNAGSCPYDALQLDIVEVQNAGGCTVVCGDMNARTAELDDYIRLADLQDYVDVPDEGAYLNSYIPSKSNCDKKPPGSGTWGCELLELCRSTELLIANGRTLGDVKGEYTFTSPRGQSTVDYP